MTRWIAVALGALALGAPAAAQQADAPLDLDCLIEPRSVANLSPAADGIIAEILVDRGQPVARLDDSLEALQVDLARARAASDVVLRQQVSRRELRQTEFDRVAALEERNVSSTALRQTAEIELRLAEMGVEEAQLARDLAEIELAQMEAMRDRRTLRSPFAGVVTEVTAAPGEFATKQTAIVTVAEIDPLYVNVFVPAEAYARVAPGDTRIVRQERPVSFAQEAVVTVVDSVFDAASATFAVRLELPNPDGAIPAGTKCRVAF